MNDYAGGSPAFNLNLSSVLFASANTVNKSAATLTAVMADKETKEWKLTLLDSGKTVAVQTGQSAVRNGAEVTVPYTYSGNDVSQISVMITNGDYTSSGTEILYYGKLNTTLASKGTGTFILPTGLPSGYKIYILAEDVNDAKYTDYASAPKELEVHIHTFKWITDKEATETENGLKHEECTGCGYKKTVVTIPKIVKPAEPAEPEIPQLSPGKKVTDAKTKAVYKAKKDGTVEYVKSTSKKAKKITIRATVVLNGVTYKVTSIAAKAFKGNKKLTKVTIGKNITKIGKGAFRDCKKLKKIVIKSIKLQSVGKKAIKGIDKEAVIKVPKKKLNKYKKLFKSSTGFRKTMKIAF